MIRIRNTGSLFRIRVQFQLNNHKILKIYQMLSEDSKLGEFTPTSNIKYDIYFCYVYMPKCCCSEENPFVNLGSLFPFLAGSTAAILNR